MKKKSLLTAGFISALFLMAIAGAKIVNFASANPSSMPPPPPIERVFIRDDGSIDLVHYGSDLADPSATIPINQVGNVYVLTDNLLNHTVEVQRDNIIIDGAGFILQGTGHFNGITLKNRSNVTIENIDFKNHVRCVWLSLSSNITVINNKIKTFAGVVLESSPSNRIIENEFTGEDRGFGYGVQINEGSFYTTVVGNNFIDIGVGVSVRNSNYSVISENRFGCETGISLGNSSYNTISSNSIANGSFSGISVGVGSNNMIFENNVTGKRESGISIYRGFDNFIYENYVADNMIGVSLGSEYESSLKWEAGVNTFYRNSFVNNTQNVFIGYPQSSNFWDNGTQGNFWSNYNGTDSNGDRIGDMPYLIDDSNVDRYPLMSLHQEPLPTLVLEPVSTLLAVTVASVAFVGAGLLFYLKKRKH